nr:MAG TPA: hypothetical protein [Caudoviricetes sp.]
MSPRAAISFGSSNSPVLESPSRMKAITSAFWPANRSAIRRA